MRPDNPAVKMIEIGWTSRYNESRVLKVVAEFTRIENRKRYLQKI